MTTTRTRPPGRARRLATAAVLSAAVAGAPTACATSAGSSPALPTATSSPTSASPAMGPMGSMGSMGMSHMDHGKLSVTILISGSAYTVTGTVSPGQYVTVVNQDARTHTITSTAPGAFDVAVPHGQLVTFPAPGRAGDYAFSSQDQPAMHAVLSVR